MTNLWCASGVSRIQARTRIFTRTLTLFSTLALALICFAAVAQTPSYSDTAPDFGPNVLIFDSSMPSAAIQSKLDAIFKKQESNQFGSERYAVLFKPGRYNQDVNVGFYTQVLGLGHAPDDVSIVGALHSDANWLGNGNATCNFWRSAENLGVTPTTTEPLHWAVSQGTSLRRVHIHGSLNLWDRGWSSGGFMADSVVDGQVNSGSQQQWLSRNDEWGQWVGHNWNMVFVGVSCPPTGEWPDPTYTVIPETPLIREKPYLSVDSQGRYQVAVPALKDSGTSGTSWAHVPTPGASLPLSTFYLAHPDRDNAATINAALRNGRNLLLTPGIYHLNKSLLVTRPNTIVIGLGYATLVPDSGTPALTIADVDGVKVSGLIFDAGKVASPALLLVGAGSSHNDHHKNPSFLYDIYARVGGATAGTTTRCIQINSNDVVVDNTWLWRADHGAGADWNGNPSANGLTVNGNDVTIYGLFVEHFQGYQTLWNGNGGRVYFYQSELPYDAPTQADWQHNGTNGFASYKVANSVTRHKAWGLGIYGVFIHSSAKCFNAIETPTAPGVALHHMIAIWITGEPGTEITHVINGLGQAVNSAHHQETVR